MLPIVGLDSIVRPCYRMFNGIYRKELCHQAIAHSMCLLFWLAAYECITIFYIKDALLFQSFNHYIRSLHNHYIRSLHS
jgi:hypothetical protein